MFIYVNKHIFVSIITKTNLNFNLIITMRKLFLLTVCCMGIIITQNVNAQRKVKCEGANYCRSSLHTILIESDHFKNKESVTKAYYAAPFPNKYNDHNIGIKSLNPNDFPITDAEREAAKVKKSQMGKALAGAASEITGGIINPNGEDIPLIIDKFIEKNKIANKLVAKWFDRHEDGTFDMELIGKRGHYNASEMDANIAKNSARGTAMLADAGEELINNTFVVFSKLNFVSNELVAKTIHDFAIKKTELLKNAIAQLAAQKIADKIYEKTRKGYSVWTTSYLYKLTWNDSIAAVFYRDLWIDKSNPDEVKKKLFESTDLFKLEFVGKEKSRNLVLTTKDQASTDDIINLATIRNMDAVYAKLQKKYDVFKTKTPILSNSPLCAMIGMKEGLKGGEKFEVLELMEDEETGKRSYKKVGKITVDKKSIWDNRYNAGELADDGNTDIKYTRFKGNKKKIFAGMLIRQIK